MQSAVVVFWLMLSLPLEARVGDAHQILHVHHEHYEESTR
jgi:hypothetical protein